MGKAATHPPEPPVWVCSPGAGPAFLHARETATAVAEVPFSLAVISAKNCLVVNDRKAAQTGLGEKGKDGSGLLADPGLAHGMGSCRN